MTTLETTTNRAVLKYACQRAIFNHDGSISDIRRSVLVTISHPEHGTTSKLLSSAEHAEAWGRLVTLVDLGYTLEVYSGALLSSRSEARQVDGHAVFAPEMHSECCPCPAHNVVVHQGQEDLF